MAALRAAISAILILKISFSSDCGFQKPKIGFIIRITAIYFYGFKREVTLKLLTLLHAFAVLYTRPLANLIEQLQRLPGVGAKTAQRLSLHILKRSTEEVEALAHALIQAKQQVGSCTICGHLSAEPICEICATPSRDNSVICVVADSRDLIALEKTREYRGKYHVLGGLISPMDGISPDQLNIQSLVRRVSGNKVSEVIMAIAPSVEGETTTLYVGGLLRPFTKVTRIAFGIPMGGDLEYADEVTLAKAIEGRRELDF